jgi:hypothetical protein
LAAGCVAKKRARPDCCVVAAACIVRQHIRANGRVGAADSVTKERKKTNRRVAAAVDVAGQCVPAIGGVGTARCIVKERLKADGRVVIADRVVYERILTQDGALARYTAFLGSRTRFRRKRKAGESERNEQERAQRRAVH